MSKLKLFLILASALLISCANPNDPDNGNDTGTGDGGTGTGGGTTTGGGYVFPKGSLSQEEQQKALDPDSTMKVLFEKNDPKIGSKFFRIPALVVTKKGTIIAAADRRYNDPTDLGKGQVIDVVVKTSSDGGNTWSDAITVLKANSTASSYGDAFLMNAHDGSVLMGVVAEPGVQGRADTWIFKSTDEGKTWTKIATLGVDSALYVDKTASKGFGASGQGLTLRYGQNKGKLMFAFFQWNNASATGGLSVSSIMSSDNGQTWTKTGSIKPDKPNNNIDETKAIELSDGTILLNHRRHVSVGGRSWSKSTDGGKNWTSEGLDPEVNDPGNNADFARYEFYGRPVKTSGYVLMINSDVTANGTWFFNRKKHTIRLTENEFNNGNPTKTGKYAYTKMLAKDGATRYSGYPTISVLPDGSIITLTEEETETQRPAGGQFGAGGDDYDIIFRRFNLYWLSDGREYVDYSKDALFQQPNP